MHTPEPLTVAQIVELAGGAPAIAAALGLHRTTPYSWRNTIPARHAPRVAALAGLHPSQIRPDMYEEPSR